MKKGYLCVAGDTFDQIALHLYGDENYSYMLMNANPQHVRQSVFQGGEILLVPELETGKAQQYNVAPWRKE